MHPAIDSSITFLRVTDLSRSSGFYAGALGLDLVIDQGSCRIYRLTPSSFLGLCERAESHSREVIVTIVTQDVDHWHALLAERGVETDGVPRHNDEYGIYHFYVDDPDGNHVEVQRFDDPRWSERQK